VAITDPVFLPVSRPVALAVASVESEVVHVTLEVMSLVVPSLYLPCATSCSVAPAETDVTAFLPVTVMDVRVGVPFEFCDLLLPPPQPVKPRQTNKIVLNNKPNFFIVPTSSSMCIAADPSANSS